MLWRLLRRTYRRIHRRTVLWHGNLESSWPDAIRYLIWPAVRSHFRNRRDPLMLEAKVVRLRSPAEVERWLHNQATASRSGNSGASERQKTPPFSDT